MSGLWLPDNRLTYPRMLTPKVLASARYGVDRTNPLTGGLIDALLPIGKRYVSACDAASYEPELAATEDYQASVDVHGRSIYPQLMTSRTYRLSPANSDSKFTRPSRQVTVLAIVRRIGNATGNAPIFSWGTPSITPYTAWGIVDRTGLGTLRFEFATSTGYKYIEEVGAFTGDYQIVIATFKNGHAVLYSDGVILQQSYISGSLLYPSATNAGPAIGNFYDYTVTPRSFNGHIYMCCLWDRALSAVEVQRLSVDPYQFLVPA